MLSYPVGAGPPRDVGDSPAGAGTPEAGPERLPREILPLSRPVV
ncbi:hypothetical protein [Micromonospora avicenniae]